MHSCYEFYLRVALGSGRCICPSRIYNTRQLHVTRLAIVPSRNSSGVIIPRCVYVCIYIYIPAGVNDNDLDPRITLPAQQDSSQFHFPRLIAAVEVFDIHIPKTISGILFTLPEPTMPDDRSVINSNDICNDHNGNYKDGDNADGNYDYRRRRTKSKRRN